MKTTRNWQPSVKDQDGKLRKRFEQLSDKTGIKKCVLSSKIFFTGLNALEKIAETAEVAK